MVVHVYRAQHKAFSVGDEVQWHQMYMISTYIRPGTDYDFDKHRILGGYSFHTVTHERKAVVYFSTSSNRKLEIVIGLKWIDVHA